MDSGVKASGGLIIKLSPLRQVSPLGGIKYPGNYFSYSDCLLLVQALDKNFGLKATIQSTGVSSQYRIYIPKESMGELRDLVSPFITSEMKYKLLP
jgi:hypothetical protein